MRLLLDACVPRKLKRDLADHNVWTARERGWNRLQDDLLLEMVAGEVDALITADRSPRFQQRLERRPFAVIVLRAKATGLNTFDPSFPHCFRLWRR